LLYKQPIDLLDSLCEFNPFVTQHPNRTLQVTVKASQDFINVLKLYPFEALSVAECLRGKVRNSVSASLSEPLLGASYSSADHESGSVVVVAPVLLSAPSRPATGQPKAAALSSTNPAYPS
jgi:hypothetical protein